MKIGQYEHNFVTRGARRTLLLLHGTGGDENSLITLGELVDPNANLLSPRGNVMENGSPRFFRRFAEGVFDLEDLQLRSRQLAEFTKEAADRYSLDSSEIVALGFSNGANIASSMMLLGHDVLRAAILLRAMQTIEPAAGVSLVGRSVLIQSGAMDPIVPLQNATGLARQFSDLGANVKMDILATAHTVTRDDVENARQFLANRPTRESQPPDPPSR